MPISSHSLTVIDDYVRFGAVCIPWRKAFISIVSDRPPSCSRLPFLLIAPPPPEVDTDYDHRILYSLARQRVYDLHLKLPHNKVCRGSSFGWLITLETRAISLETRAPYDCSVQLHNPFLNRIIDLPPLDNIVEQHPDTVDYLGRGYAGYYIAKAVLSSDPLLSPNDFVVLAIMSRFHGLAFYKPGNSTWTSIGDDWRTDMKNGISFLDVIFSHKTKQFYALIRTGEVLAIDVSGDDSAPKITQVALPSFIRLGLLYLVEDSSSGDLFHVLKYHEDAKRKIIFLTSLIEGVSSRRTAKHDSPETMIIRFKVFKLYSTSQNWVEVDNIGQNVMFLGANGSIIRSASDCPGCEPNCIYYTNSNNLSIVAFKSYGPPWDGIHRLEDGVRLPHYSSAMSTKRVPQAIWVEPTLKLTT